MSSKNYRISPPPKDVGEEPLFRVVYAIDVNASDEKKAAEQAWQMMRAKDAFDPILMVMDSEGKQVSYTEGMEIQHCVTCHNLKMENKKLNSLMQAAHTRCKGCHKKVVEESGTAGPIGKCRGCHVFEKDK